MRLSTHFELEEFTKGKIVDIPADVVQNIQRLVNAYLQPMRLKFCEPIVINSGYRTEAENRAAGGAKNSYHLFGLAADIRCKDTADAIQKASWALYRENEYAISSNKIAELIISRSGNVVWLHLAIRKSMRDTKHYVDFQGYM